MKNLVCKISMSVFIVCLFVANTLQAHPVELELPDYNPLYMELTYLPIEGDPFHARLIGSITYDVIGEQMIDEILEIVPVHSDIPISITNTGSDTLSGSITIADSTYNFSVPPSSTDTISVEASFRNVYSVKKKGVSVSAPEPSTLILLLTCIGFMFGWVKKIGFKK